MNEVQTTLLLVVAIIISVVHYLSDKVSGFMEKHHYKLLSFNGGLFLALILLILLPEVTAFSDSVSVYFLMLMGFVIFHLAGKFLYQHVKNKQEMLGELKVLHEVGFFLDHFMLGFVLVTAVDIDPTLGFVIAIPIFLHTFSSSISMQHIHESARTGTNKIILSLSTLLGVIVALVLKVEENIQGAILALLLGMLLYIGIRDFIPREEKGSPVLFLVGVGVVILSWLVIG
jgi:zinc transporter ZupT